MGVSRRFLRHWDEQRAAQGKASHATLGACQSDGQGSTNAPVRARILQQLGYPTLLLIDNDDKASDPGVAEATASGAQIVRWLPGHALEDEVAATLSPVGLAALVGLAAELKDEQSVLNAIGDRLAGTPKLSGLDPSAWVTASRALDEVRVAIGAAAKGRKVDGDGKEERKAWFKQEASGELLGGLLIAHWHEIEDQPLGAGLKRLYAFVYGEELS